MRDLSATGNPGRAEEELAQGGPLTRARFGPRHCPRSRTGYQGPLHKSARDAAGKHVPGTCARAGRLLIWGPPLLQGTGGPANADGAPSRCFEPRGGSDWRACLGSASGCRCEFLEGEARLVDEDFGIGLGDPEAICATSWTTDLMDVYYPLCYTVRPSSLLIALGINSATAPIPEAVCFCRRNRVREQ